MSQLAVTHTALVIRSPFVEIQPEQYRAQAHQEIGQEYEKHSMTMEQEREKHAMDLERERQKHEQKMEHDREAHAQKLKEQRSIAKKPSK